MKSKHMVGWTTSDSDPWVYLKDQYLSLLIWCFDADDRGFKASHRNLIILVTGKKILLILFILLKAFTPHRLYGC